MCSVCTAAMLQAWSDMLQEGNFEPIALIYQHRQDTTNKRMFIINEFIPEMEAIFKKALEVNKMPPDSSFQVTRDGKTINLN